MKNKALITIFLMIAFMAGQAVQPIMKYFFSSRTIELNDEFTCRMDEFDNAILIHEPKNLIVTTNSEFVSVYFEKSILTFGLVDDGYSNITLTNFKDGKQVFHGSDREGDGVWDVVTK